MTKIAEAFQNKKAFIGFLTAGDPSLECTEEFIIKMEEAGAALIEIGIPFSDPTAEGPVIQEANVRALAGGVTTDKVFAMVEKIRKNTSIPMVFMTYANVVFSYGIERFCKRAAEVGMDGMILPDVPFEEKEEFASVAEKYGLNLISLIAPTSHERISMIAKEAEGFVYCVSSLGVTGMRSQITTDIEAMVPLVKAQTDIPCAVGFGISTPELFVLADGAVLSKRPDIAGLTAALQGGELTGVTDRLCNVFEEFLPERYQEVFRIKEILLAHGALNAAMSGSGPTVYGIFESAAEAQRAAEVLKKSYQQTYVAKPVKKLV